LKTLVIGEALNVQLIDDSGDVSAAPPSFIPDLRTHAILLDVDGTIVDFAPTPREVWVSPTLRDVLSRLVAQTDGALALVSGRPVAELDLIFAPLILTVIGGHGAEFRWADGENSERQCVAPLDDKLKRELAAIAKAGPGIIVEDKDYSLALHYRLAPEKGELVRDAVAKISAVYTGEPIEILHGKFVVEIKHSGFNKASGVRRLMARPPFAGRIPIFIGDDTTDLPVFAIMPEFNGLACSVGHRTPSADVAFETPHDVRTWLQRVSRDQQKASA
jgi:trehalose 6-phosphate phosphatase